MIMVSACLAGFRCRYDGKASTDPEVVELVKRGEALPLCPEQLGGLTTPRLAAEIIDGAGVDVWEGSASVRTRDGIDVSDHFKNGAYETLRICRRYGINVAWLKSLSPSCGCGCIYDGSFRKLKRTGDGVTTALLRHNGLIVREL